MPTPLKGWCVHCRTVFEFPEARHGLVVECPACGGEMMQRAALDYRERSMQSRLKLWLGSIAVAALLLAGLTYLLWARLRAAFDLLVEATGSAGAAWACVAAGLLALACILLWVLFPVLVYFGLRNLSRRAAELEQTTKICARHLARLRGGYVSPPTDRRQVPEPPE
ncbi:MAG: hypothetical protein U1G07_26625 [Verrucomicrobiota bacterium]